MSKDTESQARNKLTKQVLIGMSLGVLLGVFLNYLNGLGELFAQWMQLQTVLSNGVFPADLFQTADQVVAEQKRLAGAYHTLFQQSFVQSAMEYLMGFYSWMVDGFLLVIGKIFVASLKMLVVPLVFVSLVCGVINLEDISKLGRLGIRTVSFYLLTTAAALMMAVTVAILVEPGVGVGVVKATSAVTTKEAPSFAQVLINIVPTNPVKAAAEGNMLQIIVLAILVGFGIAMTHGAGKKLGEFFNATNEVIMQIVTLLMKIAPFGVFALIAKVFATEGFGVFFTLAKYLGLTVTLLIAHMLLVYGLLFKLSTGLSLRRFFSQMKDTILFAFSTASSNATIPVTLSTLVKRIGVDKSIASFTVPMGATINMDGTAIMQGVATVFIAQYFGQDLTAAQYVTVVVTATLASIGTAGVPGVGLITLAMVLQQVGLPLEGIALIMGVDRMLDMVRTSVNVTGDATVSCIIANLEGKLDVDTFNSDQGAVEPGQDDEAAHFDPEFIDRAIGSKTNPEEA